MFTKTDIVILFIVLMIILIILSTFFYDRGFKDGQISYANGKIEYKLTNNPDNSTSWTHIKTGE